MNKKVLLQELAEGLSRRKDVTKKDAENFIRVLFEVIEQYLETDKIVKIKGFGTFKLVSVDSRESINVNTGERIRIKGHTKISFTPDAVLRDQVNKPFAEFETVVLSEDIDLKEMERIDMDFTELPENELEQTEESALNTEEISLQVTEPSDIPVIEAETDEGTGEAETENMYSETVRAGNRISDIPVEEAPQQTGITDDFMTLTSEPDDCVEKESDTSPVAASEENRTYHIENQQTDYQKIEDQKVTDQKVDTQHIAHQTVENQHIVQEHTEKNPTKGIRLSCAGILFLAFMILILMIGSYFAGYYQLLCPCNFDFLNTNKEQGPVLQPVISSPDSVADRPVMDKVRDTTDADTLISVIEQKVEKTVKDQTSPKDTVKPETAVQIPPQKVERKKIKPVIPQVAKGKYVIIGTRRTHTVKAGETLRSIALREYGSKGYTDYIVIYNHITDPNTIQEGMVLKLPELQTREE